MKRLIFLSFLFASAASFAQTGDLKLVSYPGRIEESIGKRALARQILGDSRLDTVETRALRILNGFNAGNGYGEIWIRDLNTFITGSLRVRDKKDVKEALLLFCKLQGADGNIPDGATARKDAALAYKYASTDLAPEWVSHKNTVETDQETSLIQAIRKYIDATGDTDILDEKVGGQTVLQRMEAAMDFLLKERWAADYGLIKGATTIDWGDVQPEKGWGVALNDKTKWTIDIYDNAMFIIALNDFMTLLPKGEMYRKWKQTAGDIKKNVRKHLWDAEKKKYIPHIYLDGSPFPADFDENEILYTGGTACAILAGLHSKSEIRAINDQFLNAAEKEKFATIGMTVYPPYPVEVFPNMAAYHYQNAGDWTWFGGRMIHALHLNGFNNEAYAEMSPMLDRVIRYGFHEWYEVRSGKPSGSGDFRGEAGVLYDAIQLLRKWAVKNQ
ncbi:glucosidase family protein [Chitinophaga rhizosphaerae]|uniref:hypothetical protein n=1 Tax=Chitinophaga rhizosphaerae TaxID=1864947 RepID=UPI001F0C8C8F|nr:hypothetical protein [Chitinophaga rhizosphaerae]